MNVNVSTTCDKDSEANVSIQVLRPIVERCNEHIRMKNDKNQRQSCDADEEKVDDPDLVKYFGEMEFVVS